MPTKKKASKPKKPTYAKLLAFVKEYDEWQKKYHPDVVNTADSGGGGDTPPPPKWP